MERNENRVYVHYKDEEKESKDTQKYEENYSQEPTGKDIQKVTCNEEQELVYDLLNKQKF